ncbi:MAG TPA: TIM-barrel domain-containing protein [Gaiellaceae bacterium]|nr:TIM-barrel domain-containing protein [Gaiellaceae bacterium]
MNLVRRTAACVVATLALIVVGSLSSAQSGSAEAAPGLVARAVAAPFALEVRDGAKALTTFGGADAPLSYWADGIQHHATRLLRSVRSGDQTTYTAATDEPGRSVSVTVRPKEGALSLTYAVQPTTSVNAVGFGLTAPASAHFLGSGERTGWVDMRGTVVPLKVWSDCKSSSPSPFFLSTAGFGAWVSTAAVGRMAFPGAVDDTRFACSVGSGTCPVGLASAAVRFCFKTARATVTVETGSLRRQLERHARAVGLPRAPWLPQFALIKWRDRVSGPGDLYDDIKELRARHLPIGWILLDNPWEQGAFRSTCYGALTFDTSVFPDPRGMIRRIHRQGVRFMLWISPQVNRGRGACAAPQVEDGWMTGNDRTYEWDLTLPAARAAYRERLERLVDLGVDGFKGDRGDEVDLEPNRLAAGPGTAFHNLLPLLYDEEAARALASRHGSQFATLFRAFVPGSSSVLPGLVGPDAAHDYGGLREQIRAAQTSGVAGASVWGSDVGGYTGGTLTAGLFVRWAQFASVLPIFEVGGDGANARFWRLGAGAVAGFRAAATLHYELVPYLYALAVQASRTGLPVVRPLGLDWPADERAWANDLEFTVGSQLLVSPVTDDRATSSVYLPAGQWIDLFSGRRQSGGRAISRRSGARDFPLYVKVGSAIPLSLRTPRIWRADWRPDDLLRNGRQGWLAAPARGAVARSVADRGSVLTSTADRAGVTRVEVTHPLREEQFLLYPPAAACGVTVGGRPLPLVRTDALPVHAAAWTRFRRGILVKVTGGGPRLELQARPCHGG